MLCSSSQANHTNPFFCVIYRIWYRYPLNVKEIKIITGDIIFIPKGEPTGEPTLGLYYVPLSGVR